MVQPRSRDHRGSEVVIHPYVSIDMSKLASVMFGHLREHHDVGSAYRNYLDGLHIDFPDRS